MGETEKASASPRYTGGPIPASQILLISARLAGDFALDRIALGFKARRLARGVSPAFRGRHTQRFALNRQ
jgi:hypothetical protein